MPDRSLEKWERDMRRRADEVLEAVGAPRAARDGATEAEGHLAESPARPAGDGETKSP